MAKHTLHRLNDRLRDELDILSVVEAAERVCRLPEICARIADFRKLHEGHAKRLREMIVARGGTPAERRHWTGVLMSASARIGAHHDPSALRFLRRDLERIASRYEGVLFDEDLEDEEREVYEQILADKRLAMQWLDKTLRERGWEEVPPPWPIP